MIKRGWRQREGGEGREEKKKMRQGESEIHFFKTL